MMHNRRRMAGASMAEFGMLVRDLRTVYGAQLLVFLALTLLAALGEGAGIVLLLPLLTALGVNGPADGALSVDSIRQFMGSTTDDVPLAAITGGVILTFFLQMLLTIHNCRRISTLQRDYAGYWQRRLFGAFLRARWSFFLERKSGELASAITTETTRLAGAFFLLAQLATTAVLTLVYLVFAFSVSWQATLMLLVTGSLLVTGARHHTRESFRIGQALGPLNAELGNRTMEYLNGAKLIKATATEARAEETIAGVVERLQGYSARATFLPGMVRAVFEFASMSALCVMLVVGHHHLEISTASMLVVLAMFVRLFPRINALLQYLQVLNTYIPAIAVLSRLAGDAEAEREPTSPVGEEPPRLPKGEFHVHLELAGYRDHVVLRDIDLAFPARGFIGVVGESGSGKSTLLNAMLGLADIQSGDVRIGTSSIHTVAPIIWRRHIGYVGQDSILFHDSIRENIAWAVPGASDSRVRDAAQRANAHAFIDALSNGYETQVGDQGMKLSGGQRQRLGLARALLGNPDILLLDEATSALDSVSEAEVMRTIEGLRRDICVVAVAHRLTTVRNADCIVVLRAGTVVESGSWAELMARNGELVRMARAQHLN